MQVFDRRTVAIPGPAADASPELIAAAEARAGARAEVVVAEMNIPGTVTIEVNRLAVPIAAEAGREAGREAAIDAISDSPAVSEAAAVAVTSELADRQLAAVTARGVAVDVDWFARVTDYVTPTVLSYVGGPSKVVPQTAAAPVLVDGRVDATVLPESVVTTAALQESLADVITADELDESMVGVITSDGPPASPAILVEWVAYVTDYVTPTVLPHVAGPPRPASQSAAAPILIDGRVDASVLPESAITTEALEESLADVVTTDTLQDSLAEVVSTADLKEALADVSTRGRMPVMAITLAGGADPVDKDTYVSGTYAITDTDSGVVAAGGIRLRGRGNSTWERPKKPWRVNFDVKTAPLGMTASQRNWALLANDFDSAKIGDTFALELGSRMSGLGWTPQARTVELVLNGTYRGIYALADLVRMEAGRVPGAGNAKDGAWLLELSNKERPGSPNASGAPGFASATFDQWLVYDTPEAPTTAQKAHIAGKIAAFEQALRAGDWAAWKTLADPVSFADWWLVNELIRNQDSAYFASSCKVRTGVDGIIRMGPLWDHDLSLSVAWGDLTQAADAPAEGWWTRESAWIRRMWDDAAWRVLAQQRWAVLLDALENMGGVNRWIDRALDHLDRAIRDDNRRWNQTTFTTLEADKRKRWLGTRMAWLGAQINSPIDPVTSTVTPAV